MMSMYGWQKAQDRAARNAQSRDAALIKAHAEAHRLIDKLTMMVDSVDPDYASWGDVGTLSYYVDRLREMTGEVG